MLNQLRPALLLLLVLSVLTGVLYPLVITGLAQLIWPAAAHGSLIHSGGSVVGSTLIGQTFSTPGYFHPRPSGAGKGYDASASSGTNLGPTSRALIDAVRERVAAAHSEHPGAVPADLVTSSGSGLDPHLSLAAAEWQVERVAGERKVPADRIRQLVRAHVEGRQLGFLGAPRVNVLSLNLELDAQFPQTPR
jgi:K+-transporting ATPase ATPase C chain